MSKDPHGEFGAEVIAIADQIRPFLAGRPPVMQSAVLAELLGLLLAGHWIPGDPEETKALRNDVFSAHCALVHEMTEINARMLGTNQ